MSALHTATSHFYHDIYFRRFRLVYNLRLLWVTFCLWFVVVEVATVGYRLKVALDKSLNFKQRD